MPMRNRPQREPTDAWEEVAPLAAWPEQRTYEQLRPVVLFGQPVATPARETATPERTLYRRVARFDAAGMASLFAPPPPEKHRHLPEAVRRAIVALKAEHPPFRASEISDICAVRFAHRPSPHTVKRILTEDPPSSALQRFPPYRDIADPTEARLAIIRLHSEGWAVKRIAAYLECSRQQVYRTLQRWVAEGVAGLDDKPSVPRHPATTVTLRTIATVKERQENPGLGGFRIAAALRQQGIILSPRTCQRLLAKNRALYGVPREAGPPRAPKSLPFAASRPHEYRCLDIRYLDHSLGPGKIYCLAVMDGYSRAILASLLSRSQDLVPVLLALDAAMRTHGIPEALVTDSGGVFLANHLQRIYAALAIRKEEIARRQLWQNLIETAFGVQRRMADWVLAQATSWPELLVAHDQWVADDNYQDHFAHRQRRPELRSPQALLHGVCGRLFGPEDLQRVFARTRFGRVVDKAGYIRFRHWRLYGERGLTGDRVAVWLDAEHLTLVFQDEPLAQYRVTYQPARHRLKAVTEERHFETPHRSPQPPLWAWGQDEWLRVLRLPTYAPRRPRTGEQRQPPLFPPDGTG